MVKFEQFKELELKVARILEAERVENSDKLLKLKIDLGPSARASTELSRMSSGQADVRQILAGIGKVYSPEEIIGREIIVVANLEPRTFTLRPIRQTQGRPEELEGQQGSGQVVLESQGMLLAASDGGPVLLRPDREVPPGSSIS